MTIGDIWNNDVIHHKMTSLRLIYAMYLKKVMGRFKGSCILIKNMEHCHLPHLMFRIIKSLLR